MMINISEFCERVQTEGGGTLSISGEGEIEFILTSETFKGTLACCCSVKNLDDLEGDLNIMLDNYLEKRRSM